MSSPLVRPARALAALALALALSGCERDGIERRPLGPLPTHPGSGVSNPVGLPAFSPVIPPDATPDAPPDAAPADVPPDDLPGDPGPGVGPFPGDAIGPFPGDAIGPFPDDDDDALPPEQGGAFLDWLRDGFYVGFPFVTAVHDSSVHGPIRVFMNETLATSRAAGSLPGLADQHPEGSTVVAEQFASGSLQFLGWLAFVKTQPDSQSGLGWFWFQSTASGPPFVSQPGAGLCVGCHAAGDDFVLSRFPAE